MSYIDELKKAIRNLHGCEAEHLETVPIKETFQGETVWEGKVEVFDLVGHPKAKRCYAWSHATDDRGQGKRYVAVLELPPVDSPQSAVKIAAVDEIKRNNAKEGS
jgi:hypothetical protein